MPTDPLNERVSHQMYSAHIYNSVGRVFAKSVGVANITAQAANGNTKKIKVTVENTEELGYVNVGLFVLYNDSEHGFWDNEIGETVKIYYNGT